MDLGPAWLPTVGSHARLWRTTLCDGGKARRTCGKKAGANELLFLWRASPYAETKQRPIFCGERIHGMANEGWEPYSPWFLSLHSLPVRGFSFASYFISPSTHKQLFTEFEQGLVWIEEVRKIWNCNILFVFDNYCSIIN
jgi:hypothetical protein